MHIKRSNVLSQPHHHYTKQGDKKSGQKNQTNQKPIVKVSNLNQVIGTINQIHKYQRRYYQRLK